MNDIKCDESMFSKYVNVWDFGKCVDTSFTSTNTNINENFSIGKDYSIMSTGKAPLL